MPWSRERQETHRETVLHCTTWEAGNGFDRMDSLADTSVPLIVALWDDVKYLQFLQPLQDSLGGKQHLTGVTKVFMVLGGSSLSQAGKRFQG